LIGAIYIHPSPLLFHGLVWGKTFGEFYAQTRPSLMWWALETRE